MVFLKLDFAKAFDKVSWKFLFTCMERLGIGMRFINMCKILFKDASALVGLNGRPTMQFAIDQGVRQGCPLAPYVFIVVADVMAHAMRAAVERGDIQGIQLPDGNKQQLNVQYADDTSFTVQATPQSVGNLIQILRDFCSAAGLEINWRKLAAYWQSPQPRPQWLNAFDWTWANEGDLSKLLGTPFGLNLDTKDVDAFLTAKIEKKLSYWCSTRLSLPGRALIVNQVLLSTLYYFLAVWAGTIACLRKIKSLLQCYLWAGSTHRTQVRIAWKHVVTKKKEVV